jgi:hypothetical protein
MTMGAAGRDCPARWRRQTADPFGAGAGILVEVNRPGNLGGSGSVVGVEGREVHLLDRVQHEPRQMGFGQPVRHRRRQQIELPSSPRSPTVTALTAVPPVEPADTSRVHATGSELRLYCGVAQ